MCQMTRIDENQEVIARITLAVHEYDRAEQMAAEEQADNDGDKPPLPVLASSHWKLGSPKPTVSAEQWELDAIGRHPFNHFESRLRAFLTEFLPDNERPSDSIKVCF